MKGWVSTCEVTVICSTEFEQSDFESTRRSFQSVRSYGEVGGASSKGKGEGKGIVLDIAPLNDAQ